MKENIVSPVNDFKDNHYYEIVVNYLAEPGPITAVFLNKECQFKLRIIFHHGL